MVKSIPRAGEYHVAIMPKDRRRQMHGKLRKHVGEVIKRVVPVKRNRTD